MANKKFQVPVNLVNLASDPVSASEGDIYYNTTSDVVRVYANGSWIAVGSGGGSASDSFKTIAVTGQDSVVADSSTDTLNLVAGTNVSITTNATSDSITINSSASLTQEEIQDYVAPLFTHANHTNASVTYEDASNELHIDVTNAPSAGYTAVLKHDVRLNGSIAKGQAVYVSSSNGTNMVVSKASNASEATSSKTLGLLETGGTNNALVKVVTEGLLAGLDTSTAGTEGDPVWLGTDGNLIYGLLNKPVAPAHLVFIGIVTRKNSNNGEIFVKVQNGFELSELHTVLLEANGSVADNELLAYDLSSGLWKNQTAAEAGLAPSNSPTFTGSVSVATDIGSAGAYLQITNDTQTSIKSLNNSVIVAESTGVTLDTGGSGAAKAWVFKNNGDLTFPDSSNQTTAFLGISSYTTTNISEGTNLYYTDERAQDAIGTNVGSGLSYNDSTGAISNTGVLDVIGTTNEIVITGTNTQLQVGIPDSPVFVTPNIGVATATSVNGTTIPSSKTLVVTTDIGSTVQAYDADLSAIAALTGTSGILTTNGSGTWSVDTNTYSTTSHNHTINSLSNVVITGTPSDGQALVWDTTTSKWVNETVTQDLSGYQPLDQDLTDIAALSSNGFLKKTAGVWAMDTSTYLTSESDTLETVTDRGATSTNAITISNTTQSTTPTSGALIISGGVGIAKDVWIDGNLHVNGTTITENTQTVATHDNLIYLNAAQDSTITNAVGDGTYVTYTAENNYTPGMDIRVTGMDPAGYNIASSDNLTVYSATSTQFVVAKTTTGTFVSGGTAHAKEEVNPDLGFAGGYYNAGYAHAGLFRDASDGIFKFFDGYTPEPDEAVNIDTGHASFSFAPIKVESLDVTDSSTTRTNLGLVIGTNVQAYNATLAAVAGGTYSGDDSITTVGTISSGTWNGTTIGYAYGGTGLTTLGTAGQVLKVNSGATGLEWGTVSGGGGPTTTTTSITTNSATVIESFDKTLSRTGEAIIQITQGTDYYSSKVLFIHDGTTVKITEYAILESTVSAIPVTISAAINGSDVELRATITDAATTNATAKIVLTEVAV